MTGKLATAEKLIQDELDEVDRQIAALGPLRERRDRLVESLKALRRVDEVTVADLRRSAPTESDFAAVVRSTFAAASEVRVPRPSGPSQAALMILREVGRPMHLREIVAAMQAKGWFTDRDYEPLRATIASTFNASEKNADENSEKPEVRKTDPGTYEAVR
ncbi:MAG: HTH domain-containing protein [Gemmatimonadales bacterium]|nr:HTH domain-containing protein [Gemmatimonadales bacterium]